MTSTAGSDGTFTLAAAGDAIATRPFAVHEDPRFQDVIDRVRAADASVVNLEVLLHDYEGYPAANSGGTYMRAPPRIADELSWAGFDLFAAATNHAGDYSHGGMEATMRALEDRDLAYAGLGRTLADARSPAYVETPAGRVALVSACTTITPGTEAGEQRPDLHGRPGLAPLRLETRYVVPEETQEAVVELSENLGLEAVKDRRERRGFRVPGENVDAFTFVNVGGETHLQFETGDEFAVRRTVTEDDLAAFRRQVAAADRQADFVVASVHAHEGADGFKNDRSVPPFLEGVARDAVEAGADAVVGHGPHLLRGIEIYDGAPIFYSLGDFFMQNETVTRLPAEIYDRYGLDPLDAVPADLFDERVFETAGESEEGADADDTDEADESPARIGFLSDSGYWESVLPVCTFEDGDLARIELHPLDLGFENGRPRRGRPSLAEGETASRILKGLADLSAPYDTDIAIEDGRGVVTP
ncbi:MAG TPA: CapA family protein [Natrialbaceae archaeon]|nr:CapA family protein [Natrialbaceae archaeon]